MIETGLGITFDENSNEFLYPAGTFSPSHCRTTLFEGYSSQHGES